MTARTDKYKEHLDSVRWGLFRAMIIEQRRGCEICKTTVGLNLHHRHYKNLGEERDEDVYLLCNRHHHQLHFISRQKHMSYDDAFQYILSHKKLRRKKKQRKPKKDKIGFKGSIAKIPIKEADRRNRSEERKRAQALRNKRLAIWTLSPNSTMK